MPHVNHDDQAQRRPTLAPGEFLGSKRLLRSQAGWHAYKATYQPAFQCGMHDHERAALCMVLSGDYQEIADQSHMTRLFKASLGQPPAKFRKVPTKRGNHRR